MSVIKSMVRGCLNKAGWDLRRFNSAFTVGHQRMRIIREHKADLVLDIGANEGQWAGELLEAGYGGPVISFEPVRDAFSVLERNASERPNWNAMPIALGDTDGTAEINVGNKTYISSFLPLSQKLETAEPELEMVSKQETRIARLDSLQTELFPDAHKIYLKLDVQGFEQSVLAGAEDVLRNVVGIETELSLCVLYDGQWEMHEAFTRFHDLGFACTYLDPIFFDANTGQLLQVDAVFEKQ